MVTLSLEITSKHKKLTRFLSQELLYEYVSGTLDRTRRQAVEEYMKGCRDTQREFEQLKKAMTYVEKLEGVRVSPKLFEALENFEPFWMKRIQDWSLWSSRRGWKMLPYAFLFAAITLGVIVSKPWEKNLRQEVILAEQLKKEPDMLPPLQPLPPVAPINLNPRPSPLEHLGPLPATMHLSSFPVKPVQPATPATPEKPVVVAEAAKAEEVSEDAKVAEAAAQAEADEDSKVGDSSRGGGKGILMRAEFSVSDFHNTWPAVRDKIQALGGKVAGNVELGWLRKEDQSYFHFTLPESNFKELELFLGTFGPVRFTTERHPRVMPEGQVRIILTLKDGMTNEGPTETP